MTKRVLVVTDAWRPQINGVVRSIEPLMELAPHHGLEIEIISPDMFRTVPLPTYPEIKVAITSAGRVGRLIRDREPDCIHIATEGPLGRAARRACMRNGWKFSTAYHTRFPEYVAERKIAPARFLYWILRRFHASSEAVLVATDALHHDLAKRGFKNLVRWTRGVDMRRFYPRERLGEDRSSPVFIYVGRIAVEKNIDHFLSLDLPGKKVVVGDGPELNRLKREFPDVDFTGALEGEALAEAYRNADVFVFPSRTDTFGLVLLEALASGLPVAAFPVMGPKDILGESGCGVLSEDLRSAALQALNIPSRRCVEHAATFSWDVSMDQFARAVDVGPLGWSKRPSLMPVVSFPETITPAGEPTR
jgi:glycosyltransferase involved in cell wall biosynthesis